MYVRNFLFIALRLIEYYLGIYEILIKINHLIIQLLNQLVYLLILFIKRYERLLDIIVAFANMIFRENDIMYDTYTDFPGRLIDVWKTLAHGMARQCIESLVSPAEWSDMWLSKALALYLGHYEILAQVVYLFSFWRETRIYHLILKLFPILTFQFSYVSVLTWSG